MNLQEQISRWLRYNLWYLGDPPWNSGITPPELKRFIATHPPGRALDIGCGTGLNVAALARAGWEVVGVDFAYLAVQKARKRLRQNNLTRAEVYHADVNRLNWLSEKFDLILDIGCYHSLNRVERGAYRNQVFRLLKRKGDYLLYAHLREDPVGEAGITQEDLEMFEAQLVLTERADGSDRGDRKSVWLSFTPDRR